jgi:hypothetical protein
MKKDDLTILIIGLLLLAGMLITILFGGQKSLHGVGGLLDVLPKHEKPLQKQQFLIYVTVSPDPLKYNVFLKES